MDFDNLSKEQVIAMYNDLRDDYFMLKGAYDELEKQLDKTMLKEKTITSNVGTPPRAHSKKLSDLKLPVLFVLNKANGTIHRVGAKPHDELWISDNGEYIYYEDGDLNLGTRLEQDDNPNSQMYQFVNFDPVKSRIYKDEKILTTYDFPID